MSERFLHVYRVTEVAEWHVEDDGIYEDDAEMLRDVLEAAGQGVLEFAPSDAGYVAMVWDEDSRLVVRAVEESDLPEDAERTDLYCPECLGRQFLTPSGPTCNRGHGGCEGITKAEVLARRRTVAPSPEPPTRTRSLRPPRKPSARRSR
jgi:hypothetical protein